MASAALMFRGMARSRTVHYVRTYNVAHPLQYSTSTTRPDKTGYGFSVIKGEGYNIGNRPQLKPQDNSSGTVDLAKHKATTWPREDTIAAFKDHALFSWGSQEGSMATAVHVKETKGVWWYDHDGRDYIDWGSGAVCSNLGHTMPQPIKDAINAQIDTVPFVYGDTGLVDVRARLSALLAELCPADLNGFLYASSGAEANEGAIRLARSYTGRNKIMSRYRSYHGGTTSTLNLTGDPRKWVTDPFSVGFVKMLDPCPYNFEWDANPQAAAEKCLDALHEQILAEGSNTIAAIHVESITGSNGWLMPHPTYMQGVRALCDQYGILMVIDEVMTGFGRTGTMFGYQHFEGVVPDMFTFAKGSTAAYAPLSGIGVRQPILDHYKSNPTGYGSTYSAHPLSCAVAYATVKHILDIDLCTHVQAMSVVMQEEMQQLVEKHPSIKAGRVVGLAGGFDLCGRDGNYMMQMHEQTAEIGLLKNLLLEQGVIGVFRGNFAQCCPPLIITEDEIREGFKRVDRAMTKFDNHYFGAVESDPAQACK
ncbi:hypothetical protein SARC_09376 [Sphaeroforma arctica JP610]|uniref:Aminotransferase class-III n=1 Tax=Sphaeroforma arctica JP610 TaxID=667725 RepID=A0A0L0FN24_9EUKA|nr:hypothetical protein SARC_09376 [Sphaeroforma arctica JP610]KNC78180.1 hypothetical protein SARC_09376 [Sphaeroforma arctica JP610]|eukprot:XP_014152082.1 hypothetical protein SARC_09376 [Sphaeroforma arctica JP610]